MDDKQRLAILASVTMLVEDTKLITEENVKEMQSFGENFDDIVLGVTGKSVGEGNEREMELLAIDYMIKEMKYFAEKY